MIHLTQNKSDRVKIVIDTAQYFFAYQEAAYIFINEFIEACKIFDMSKFVNCRKSIICIVRVKAYLWKTLSFNSKEFDVDGLDN